MVVGSQGEICSLGTKSMSNNNKVGRVSSSSSGSILCIFLPLSLPVQISVQRDSRSKFKWSIDRMFWRRREREREKVENYNAPIFEHIPYGLDSIEKTKLMK